MEFQDLLRTLCFVGSRIFLLQVEEELKNLIQVQRLETKSDTWHRIRFPPMTSNHRWMIHATAARFGLDSTSVGWGYDRTTTITCNKNSRIPILSYSDFIPSCNSDIAWTSDEKISTEPQKPEKDKSNRYNDNTSHSSQPVDTADTKQAEKKRRRPNFSQPYSVARRMQSVANPETENANPPKKITAESITPTSNASDIQPSSTPAQKEDKLVSPEHNREPKKVRGRGAVGRMRSTESSDELDEESNTAASKETPTSPNKEATEHEKVNEEDMQPEPTVTLSKDYTKYTAETIRAQEERHNKSYADLSPNYKAQSKPSKWKEERIQISWSEAWQLRKQGKGVIEFGCNKLDASQNGNLCLYLSPNNRNTSKHSTVHISFYSKQSEGSLIDNHFVFIEIGTGIPGESNVLYTGTCPIIHENQMISFWVALTGQTIMIGAGLYPQNRVTSLSCDLVTGLVYFGFAAWNHAIRVKNISIKGAPCDILATRGHILVATVHSDSMSNDTPSSLAKMCQNLIQNNTQDAIKCYPIRNLTYFVVCHDISQASTLLQAAQKSVHDTELPLRIVDASFAAACVCQEVLMQVKREIEFDTSSRPTSDATVANRMISRFVSQ